MFGTNVAKPARVTMMCCELDGNALLGTPEWSIQLFLYTGALIRSSVI